MKTVLPKQVGYEELALPPRVQEALGELVGSAKEGLLALSVGLGLGVLASGSGVKRPRARSADGREEVRLRTYEYFADRDPLTKSVLERVLAGVSTRRYRRTQEPVGSPVEQAARSTSRSAVSRTFVGRTRRALGELMSRRWTTCAWR